MFAIKGVAGHGKAIIGRPTRNNIAKIPLFPVGVDSAKELLYSRLRIKDEGAGYCHFPKHYEQEYFMQLTAEKIVTKYFKGFPRREFVKIRPRNEALDCRVYSIASLSVLNTDINKLAERLEIRSEKKDNNIINKEKSNMKKNKPNFVHSWDA